MAAMSSLLTAPNPFADAVRRRRDVRLVEVTPVNRDSLAHELRRELGACFS